MALIVWLPFTQNNNNQGLLNLTATNLGSVSYVTGGKFGKCLSAGVSTKTVNGISYNSNLVSALGSEYSAAIWVKPLGTHVNYNGTFVSSGNWNNSCWSFGVSQDNSQVDVFCSKYNTYINCSVPVNEWTHLVCSCKNGIVKLYKNGTYVGERAVGTTLGSDASNFTVGRETYADGYFSFNGNINDLRIYNHALSENEVREISKGLALHWACNNSSKGKEAINPNLIKNTSNGSNWTYSTFTKETRTFTRSTTATSESFVQGRADLDNTKTYTMSAEVKTNGQVSSVELFAYDNTVKDIRSKNIGAPTEWTKVFLTFTPSTSYSWSNCCIRFDNNGSKTSGTEAILYVRNIKVEEGSSVSSWCPHTTDPEYSTFGYNSTVERDLSGLQRDGTLVSAFPTVEAGAPRYSCSYKYAGNVNNVHYNTTTELNYTDNFSWSIWVKTNYTGSTAQYVFTVGRADAGGYGYGLTCTSTTNCYLRFGNSGWNVSVTGGEWTHIGFTKSGTTIKIYKNGNLYSTNTFSGTLPTYSDGNGVGIGCFHYSGNIYPYYGNISDFRIYATALSDDDMKRLYSTAASISNNGVIMAYEFIEE